MSKTLTKNQVKVIAQRMKELGYPDFNEQHGYEIIAALMGEKSWNVAVSKMKKGFSTEPKPDLSTFQDKDVVTQVLLDNPDIKAYPEVPLVPLNKEGRLQGSNFYLVRVEAKSESKLIFNVCANSEQEANTIVKKHLGEKDYDYTHWETIWLEDHTIKVIEDSTHVLSEGKLDFFKKKCSKFISEIIVLKSLDNVQKKKLVSLAFEAAREFPNSREVDRIGNHLMALVEKYDAHVIS